MTLFPRTQLALHTILFTLAICLHALVEGSCSPSLLSTEALHTHCEHLHRYALTLCPTVRDASLQPPMFAILPSTCPSSSYSGPQFSLSLKPASLLPITFLTQPIPFFRSEFRSPSLLVLPILRSSHHLQRRPSPYGRFPLIATSSLLTSFSFAMHHESMFRFSVQPLSHCRHTPSHSLFSLFPLPSSVLCSYLYKLPVVDSICRE